MLNYKLYNRTKFIRKGVAMKKATLLSLSVFFASNLYALDEVTVKQEGIKYIKMLGGALKKEMKTHMKKDPSGLEALAFCSAQAEEITKKVNTQLPNGVTVRRTALRLRNDKTNKADDIDIKVMESYEKALAEGKTIAKSVKVVDTGDTYRVYKPLLTQKVCLKCHGANIDPKIAEGLKHAYPNDKAIGFKEGDLRGVIVAEIPKRK
jgi:hypothetical protein